MNKPEYREIVFSHHLEGIPLEIRLTYTHHSESSHTNYYDYEITYANQRVAEGGELPILDDYPISVTCVCANILSMLLSDLMDNPSKLTTTCRDWLRTHRDKICDLVWDLGRVSRF